MIVAGIDEAGYGPSLGPLVVSAAVFRVPDDPPRDEPADLWKPLEAVVCREKDDFRIPVDDSKKLFQQKKGLRLLEEGLLPFLCLRGHEAPRDLRELICRLVRRRTPWSPREWTRPTDYLDGYPWYRGRNLEIPVETFRNFVQSRGRQLEAGLRAAGTSFLGLASYPLDVLEFNEAIRREENKARVSFRLVAGFLRRLWSRFPEEDVQVTVDRQGGRVYYGRVLFRALRPRGIRVETEDEAASEYGLSRPKAAAPAGRRPGTFRIRFLVDSESRCLPVALASMASKYLREVHMLLFNKFWLEQQEGLRPTAGYALDARRFLRDIAPLRKGLGIEDEILVRKR